MGHFIYLARIKQITVNEAWERSVSYNVAQISPPCSEAELKKEFFSLYNLDRKKHSEGPSQDTRDGAPTPDPDHIDAAIKRVPSSGGAAGGADGGEGAGGARTSRSSQRAKMKTPEWMREACFDHANRIIPNVSRVQTH
jgi:hypothetical protein